MFNFTTQTIFNNIEKFDAQKGTKTPKTANVILGKTNNLNPELRIGNTRFNADNVLNKSYEWKKATVESLASVSFDLKESVIKKETDESVAGIYRIAIYLGLTMSNHDSFYANDFVYKGKPLYLEFIIKEGETDGTAAAKRAVSNARKYLTFTAQENLLDIEADGSKVKITAVNGYQVIKKAVLQKYDVNAKQIDCCATEGDFVDYITGIPAVYTTDATGKVIAGTQYMDESGTLTDYVETLNTPIIPGMEAFGDYNWMIHNLRLPTLANTYFWAVTKSEMPALGLTYDQFIITLCKDRDGIAGEVVGQRATSVTNHIIYVNSAKAEEFAGYLDGIGLTKKTTADTKLKTPYGDNK